MRKLWIALLALLVVLPVAAQAETVVEVGGLEIELPDGWYTDAEYQSFYSMAEEIETVLVLHETGLEALLVSPEQVAELVPDVDDKGYQDILVELAALSYELDLAGDEEEFFTVDLGAVDGLRWFYEDTESDEKPIQGDLYLIPLEDGGYLFADIYTYQEYFHEDTDALEAAMEDLFINAGAVLLEDSSPESDSDLPEGWSVAEDDYQSFYVMSDSFDPVILLHDTGLEALIVSPEQVAELVPNAADMDYQAILTELAMLAYELETTEDSFFTVDLGAIDGIRWFYDDTESDEQAIRGDLYLIPLTDGGYLFADIYAYQTYFQEDTDNMESAMEALFLSMGVVVLED